MRLVEVVLLSEDAQRVVLDVLDREDVDYCVTDRTETPADSSTVTVPMPAHLVDPIQKKFSELDIHDDMYAIVHNPEAVVFNPVSDDSSAHTDALAPGRISRDELHTKASDLIPDFVIYTILTAISAVVATAGVLLDSLSVLIGAMVIAPLLGPAMATSVATVIDDRTLFLESLTFQLKGGLVALISAFGFAATANALTLASDSVTVETLFRISNYTSPTFLLVAVAVAAGVSGAISLSTSGSTDLVGVMVAAAVMPPIGSVGVALTRGEFGVAIGGVLVVLINVLSVNLASIVSLWYLGYKPTNWPELKATRSKLLRRIVVLMSLVVLSAVILAKLPNAVDIGVIL